MVHKIIKISDLSIIRHMIVSNLLNQISRYGGLGQGLDNLVVGENSSVD